MNIAAEIEGQFSALPPAAQLSLLERLSRRARAQPAEQEVEWEAQLARMAADPQVRREIASINAEFAAVEADGLEKS